MMREVAPGLWHWEASHPDWEASERWDRMVSSYAIDDGERLLRPLLELPVERVLAAHGGPTDRAASNAL